jgi:hypothetical protein
VIHCIKYRSQTYWFFLIIFLPVVGCIAYIFLEMLRGKTISDVNLNGLFASRPSIKRLEDNLRFSDTFNNRVVLADAYLASGETDRAIDLYESSLTGAFEENEYVRKQLITAYSERKQYDKVVAVAKKIYNLPTFPRSRAHMLYAIALENVGLQSEAEKEFLKMQSRFSFYEARHQYGLFLIRSNRKSEAINLFESMLDESSHLSPREKRNAAPFLRMVRDELKSLAQYT